MMTKVPSVEAVPPNRALKIGDIMSPYLELVDATDSVEHAAGRMRAFALGSLLVRDDQEVVGMITDRDITVRVTAAGKNARLTAVSEVMSPGIVCCDESKDVEEIVRMMEANQLHRIAVIDREGHPTGIVSVGDLARNGCERLAARVVISNAQSVPSMSSNPWMR